ncbi:MAG: hypothetical protein DRP93_05175 [Candidatus Neomarinimicrobiota bacterium]|nr:MAG: hypothetical protein DRP93_05175 [Candidatus Neomarinimicrobiota bacterium]
MELTVNVDYEQILGLIYQLPKKEIEKLTITLQSEILSKKSTKSIQELILNAPTWSDPEFDNYQKARNHIEKSRIA